MTEPIVPMAVTNPSPNGQGGNAYPPLNDLPPVEAPSAGFIVQLFVIPAVIVAVVIAVWLLFGKLAGGERDAMEYVRLMRASSNNDRAAKRAAFELASLIQNDSKLASDPKLLGELTDLLEHELDTVENPVMAQYVALAIGRFHTFEATAANGQTIDVISTLDRALDPKFPNEVRIAAAASLAQHGARLKGKLDDPRPVAALAKAGREGPPEFRQMAAYALGFLGGNGSGEALRGMLQDEDRFVRYNAAVALGRRDDEAALETFREMLSTSGLDKVVPVESASERGNKVEAIELEALHALQTAVDEKHTKLVTELRPEVTELSRSGLASVRNKASGLLKSLPAAG